jgi:hypothetical protein
VGLREMIRHDAAGIFSRFDTSPYGGGDQLGFQIFRGAKVNLASFDRFCHCATSIENDRG